MSEHADEIALAWRTNCTINRLVIEHASDEGWHCTLSKRGGRGVSGEFAHVHNLRLAHLQKRAKDLAEGMIKLSPGDHPTKADVLEAFDQSDAAVRALLVGALLGEPKRRGFKRGIFTTLGYFVSHEAHHRGRALLTLKACGHTLDRDVQMRIWAWDQI